MNESVERASRTQVLIPGVGGHTAAEILDPPRVRLVAGDRDAGFYQQAAPDGVDYPGSRTEAYSWSGLTSGDWIRALWLLLLPFMLANVAFWMAPAVVSDPDVSEEAAPSRWRRGAQLTAAALQRLLALTLTAAVVTAAISVSMDLVGWQCVADGRSCISMLSFLAWPWLTDPLRRVLTAAVPVALVLLLWWLGNRTWQQMESVAVPPATPVGIRTPLEDRRMWNGRRSVRVLRAVHVTAAFAIIAVFLVVGSLARPAHGLASVVDPYEWRRPWGWPVVGVLAASLALLAGLIVMALLPMAGRRDRPGATSDSATTDSATTDSPALEGPLFRWLPWLGAALVVLAGAATLGTAALGPLPAGGRPSALPWISGAITVLFASQAAATAVLAWCCWLSLPGSVPRTTDTRPTNGPPWHGMACAVTAGLAWLLQDGLAAGVTLLAADRLGTPGPPSDAAAHHRYAFVVAPPVLWAAVTAVGLACVLLIAGAALLVARRSPPPSVAQKVKQAYRYQNLDSAPPGSARQRRAEAIARDWTRGAMVETLARRGGWLAVGVAIVVTTGVVLDLTTPSDFFARSGRWPVTVGSWLLGGLVLVLFYVGRQAYSSPAWRRTVGVLWDVGTFWPRATHPLAPPCYAERAVPDLLNRITYLAGTWEQPQTDAGWGPPPGDGQALVLAYSQGSVIAAATVMQLSVETGDHVRLLTYGSPLRPLYARFFPAYFGPSALRRLSGFLGAGEGGDVAGARWRNLYRPSDPIGGYVFTELWPQEYADKVQRRQAAQDQLAHTIDCVLLDPIFGKLPGDSRYPPTYAHFDYPKDAAFAQAVAWLWRQGQTQPVPSEDAAGPAGLPL